MWAKNKQSGFTIVELLIVVVVIAILAAITIVSYNGIQQRSNNTAIISAVSQTSKLIKAYYAVNTEYPSTSAGNICVTTVSGCIRDTGIVDPDNASFNTNLKSVGSPPSSIPSLGTRGNGIIYNYLSTRTYNGQAQPVLLFYWLNGTNQQCGVDGVMSTWELAVTAGAGYTSGNSAGKTLCYISVSV